MSWFIGFIGFGVEDGGDWITAFFSRWGAGRLGGKEAGKLGGLEAGRFGGLEAGRFGGLEAGAACQ